MPKNEASILKCLIRFNIINFIRQTASRADGIVAVQEYDATKVQ